jgi:hypothetical protein
MATGETIVCLARRRQRWERGQRREAWAKGYQRGWGRVPPEPYVGGWGRGWAAGVTSWGGDNVGRRKKGGEEEGLDR